MEEKKYVDFDEVITTYKTFGHLNLHNALEAFNKIPAADVVPVVLCRNCMYAPSGTDGGEDQGFDLEWPHDKWPEHNPCPYKCDDGWYSLKPKPDFFCANGKVE